MTLHKIKTTAALAAATSLLVAVPAIADGKDGHARAETKPAEPAVSPCAPRLFSEVFAAFRDHKLYTPAPDGDFEAGAAEWTLSEGAVVADESSSILLGEALGAKSVELAPGASVTSPAICVERGFPSFRFATRAVEGKGARVRVDVIYRNGRKIKKSGPVKAGADWRVTRKVSLAQGRFRIKRGQSAEVQLKFTASRGTVRIDDVYVDPRYRG